MRFGEIYLHFFKSCGFIWIKAKAKQSYVGWALIRARARVCMLGHQGMNSEACCSFLQARQSFDEVLNKTYRITYQFLYNSRYLEVTKVIAAVSTEFAWASLRINIVKVMIVYFNG